MDEIAARAGLGVGTVYRHFSTKDALIEAIIRERQAQVLAAARAALESADPWEGFATFAWHVVTLETEDRALAEVLAGAERRSDFQHSCGELEAQMAAVVARAQAAGQMRADVSAQDVFAALCIAGQAGQHHASSDTGFWRRLVTILLDGLRARPTQADLLAETAPQPPPDDSVRRG